MLRSLAAGVSGLRIQQTKMDVIGNDISNVNTTGYKSSRVTFKEGFDQLLQAATPPQFGGNGGLDPEQIGLGAQIGSVDTVFEQGNLDNTGVTTDLALQGNSFFVLANGNQQLYTRDGNFQLDSSGRLVSGTSGLPVQGRTAVNGQLTGTIGNITLPYGQKVPAAATTSITLAGNLDASAPAFDSGSAATVDPLDATQRGLPQNASSYKDMSVTTYDSLGNKQDLKIVMWKTGTNTWDWKVDPSSMDITSAGVTENAGTHPFTFASDGTLDTSSFTAPSITFTPNDGADPVTMSFNPGSGTSGLSQFAGSSNAVISDQNGYTSGTLESYTIDNAGEIVGTYTNGSTMTLAQIALADFNNPGGLTRDGDNNFTASADSGIPVLGYVGSGASSTISSGNLEMSNVDLAQEFTDMIVAQRGFQANGKVITTSDQMLQDLVQLRQ